jgi:hypothetical protein
MSQPDTLPPVRTSDPGVPPKPASTSPQPSLLPPSEVERASPPPAPTTGRRIPAKAYRQREKKLQSGEISDDFQRLIGLQPETHQHTSPTAPIAMKVGRRVLLPHDKPASARSWFGKNVIRWMKRLYKEDLPVVTLATAAALFGAFVLGGPLPDPRVAERAAILRTALIAAVTEAGVLYPLVFAVSSIRNHRLHGFKSLRAIGRGLHGTAVRMAGLFTAKKVLGLAVHTAAIATATVGAALLPIGVAGAWALGVVVGNVAATGVMLCVGDVAERGLLWVGRKLRPLCDRLFPRLKRARERDAEHHNDRVRHATRADLESWRDRQEWRAIDHVLAVYDRVGGKPPSGPTPEVQPKDSQRALRRRLSDYRVANYALMEALKACRKDSQFRFALGKGGENAATRIETFLRENERLESKHGKHAPAKREHAPDKAALDAYQEGRLDTNPFFPEIDRLDREHALLLRLADDAAALGIGPARHVRAAAEVALRDSPWGRGMLERVDRSSNLFRRPGIDVVGSNMELVREPLLDRHAPQTSSATVAA